MAENDEPTSGPAEPTPAPAPADETVEQTTVANEAAPAPVAAEKQKFTDRLWNFRAMVAVALAALLLGAGAGAAIAAASHDDRDERHPGFMRWQDGGPGMMPGPGMRGFDPQQRQQFREGLKDLRQKMRQRMKEHRQDETPAPTTPSPSATPNG